MDGHGCSEAWHSTEGIIGCQLMEPYYYPLAQAFDLKLVANPSLDGLATNFRSKACPNG